jgi:chemotaxis protein MotB
MASKGRAKDGKDARASVVIRREEVVEGGHHGGAWKVAYADFVTAMMAFFLLMWLINATTEEQRRGLADYFAPMNAMARSMSGSGAPFGGRTPYEQGAMVSDLGTQTVIPGKSSAPGGSPDDSAPPPPTPPAAADAAAAPPAAADAAAAPPTPAGATAQAAGNAAQPVAAEGAEAPGGGVAPKPAATPGRAEFLANAGAGVTAAPDLRALDTAALRTELARREQAEFAAAAQAIRDAVASEPALAGVARQLAIDVTPEGLRIQLLDADQQPMFASGSAEPNERARLLLQAIAPVLARLPQPVAIAGHTDAAPYKGAGRSNWDLSSDRAGATRRLLAADGLPEARFREVTGRADRELLLPADPLAAANRRIAILVMATTPLPVPGAGAAR